MEKTEEEMKLPKGYEEGMVTIERLECTEVVRTIGVRICPSGQQVTEFKFRMGQAGNFAKKIRDSKLSRHMAIQYKSVFLPMILYPLGEPTPTPTQLARIHSVAK